MRTLSWNARATALAAALLLPVGAAAQRPVRPARPVAARPVAEPPRLLVFLTIDQMREDYLERFGSQLTGGLGRLARQGAFFTRAYHDHAVTETAVGHAVVLSGRFPRSTGILDNAASVQDSTHPLIGSSGAGASPARFRGSSLFDWLQAADPESRALSISRKDRAAILPMGRARQQVYFYAGGRFTTSTYYADSLPQWVQRFNARGEPQSYAGKAWTPLLPDSAYHEPDSVSVEAGGKGFTFPHPLQSAPQLAAASLAEYPFMDQVTLDMALAGVQELELGARAHTDLLAISLSTTDAIGHRYGPDSREIHDHIVRLDRMLGVFIDSIYRLRDSTRVVFALTGDHGVSPFPDLRAATPAEARAMHVSLAPVARALLATLSDHGVPAAAVTFGSGMLELDEKAVRAQGVDPDSLLDAFVAGARATPGVARAERFDRLTRADTVHDAIARRWLHMIPSDQPVGAVVTLKPLYVWGNGTSASHGSAWDDDAHVPLILYGPVFRPGRYAAPVRVVDLAPTLAAALRVRPTERVDGRVLTQALRAARP